ncbi:unnamed protein product, partial [marine sediment metagenome]
SNFLLNLKASLTIPFRQFSLTSLKGWLRILKEY